MIIYGADIILRQGDNFLFGVQSFKRWVKKKDSYLIAIKTIGGKIEENDKNPQFGLLREVSEELIFKSEKGEILPPLNVLSFQGKGPSWHSCYEHGQVVKRFVNYRTHIYVRLSKISFVRTQLELRGKFYSASLDKKVKVFPNDIPAILSLPQKQILKMKFYPHLFSYHQLQRYIIAKAKDKRRLRGNFFYIMLPEVMKDILFR